MDLDWDGWTESRSDVPQSTDLVLTRFSRFLQATAELAATYAALILADDGIEITVRLIVSLWIEFASLNLAFV